MSGQNTGHGHVFPRPDGVRARCGGPAICSMCAKDQAARLQSEQKPASLEPDDPVQPTDRDRWANDVLTLIGYAEFMRMDGKTEMPAYLLELAERIARAHVDEAHARRCTELRAPREEGHQ